MTIKNTFPIPARQTLQRQHFLKWFRIPYWLLAAAALIVNGCTGAPWWSGVAVWSMYMLWTDILSPALVDMNRISLCIRVILQCIILQVLIDVLIVPGWIFDVAPIFCFAGLLLAAILFFSDFSRQRHNMVPLLLVCVTGIAAAVLGLTIENPARTWTVIVLGSVSLAVLVACAASAGGDLFRLLRRYFHLK